MPNIYDNGMKYALLLTAALGLAQTPAPGPTSTYYVVVLRPAAQRKALSKQEAARLKAAHLANVRKMLDDGVLAAAGPFDNDPGIDGIFVMKTDSRDQARYMIAQDPMVHELHGILDVHTWLAPAGIGDEYRRLDHEHPDENLRLHPIMILNHGRAWNSTDPKQRVVPLANHIVYVERLHRGGKLGAAGEVEGDTEMVGIVIFQKMPLNEARNAMEDDPAVKSGLLAVDAHLWWCADHVLPW